MLELPIQNRLLEYLLLHPPHELLCFFVLRRHDVRDAEVGQHDSWDARHLKKKKKTACVHGNKETKPLHWRTRKQYSTQVTRLPHRGAC